MTNSDYFVVTDKELIIAARKGSQEAFSRLYRKYWMDLYRIAYKRLPDEDDVKDILQDTFVSLWKNLDHLSVDESIAGYLYIILRNKIFNYYQKNKLKLRTLLNQPFNPVQSENDIYSSLSTKEIKTIVNAIVAGMPSKMREIYLLSRNEQLSNGEIAGLLTLSPQTVKNQVHMALLRIREEFRRCNIPQH